MGAELRAARSARSELNLLANVIRVGILLLDTNNEPVYITDPARELLAPDDAEQLSASLKELGPTISEARERLQELPRDSTNADITLPSGRGGALHLESYALEQ